MSGAGVDPHNKVGEVSITSERDGASRKGSEADRTPAHGTTTKYQRGCRCERCKEAQRTYMRRYRDTHRGREKTRQDARARGQALQRLKERYPEEYKRYYDEAKAS